MSNICISTSRKYGKNTILIAYNVQGTQSLRVLSLKFQHNDLTLLVCGRHSQIKQSSNNSTRPEQGRGQGDAPF